MEKPSLEDRFIGCTLGHALGDALGAPFEGLASDLIFAQFGRAIDIVGKPPVEKLYCTDDTHMAIALARTLCTEGYIEEAAVMKAFAEIYDPKRGYGQGMRRLLEAVIHGEDWQTLAENLFPGGSYGNGGAMRVAPVALYFHEDLDRVWTEAGKSAALTHRHPWGVEGAQLFALAVALAVRGEAADGDALFGELYTRATQEEYQWLLRTAWKLRAEDSLALLGSGLEAHRSVVTAITCFSIASDSYPVAVARALSLGNDTDTLMGMAGALSGAHLGTAGLPERALGMLENDALGREEIEESARRLYARFLQVRR